MDGLSSSGVIELRRGPGRPVGYPKTGGRPKGSKNRRTQEVEAILRPMLPRAKRAIAALLSGDDPELQLKAASLLMAYIFGRPVDRREVSNLPAGATDDLSDMELSRRIAALLLAPGQADQAAPPVPEPAADPLMGGE